MKSYLFNLKLHCSHYKSHTYILEEHWKLLKIFLKIRKHSREKKSVRKKYIIQEIIRTIKTLVINVCLCQCFWMCGFQGWQEQQLGTSYKGKVLPSSPLPHVLNRMLGAEPRSWVEQSLRGFL